MGCNLNGFAIVVGIFLNAGQPLMAWQHNMQSTSDRLIPYSGKLLREKTFANFAVLWLSAKVFSAKLGDVVFFGTAKASNLRRFSTQKSYFAPICGSFLPRKFPVYGT